MVSVLLTTLSPGQRGAWRAVGTGGVTGDGARHNLEFSGAPENNIFSPFFFLQIFFFLIAAFTAYGSAPARD